MAELIGICETVRDKYHRHTHLELAAKCAARRHQAQQLAEQLNHGLRFRLGDREAPRRQPAP